jgi:hypothetical protein
VYRCSGGELTCEPFFGGISITHLFSEGFGRILGMAHRGEAMKTISSIDITFSAGFPAGRGTFSSGKDLTDAYYFLYISAVFRSVLFVSSRRAG